MTMVTEYDAVIFDLGGVVFPSPFEAFDAYDVDAGLAGGTVRSLIKTSSETGAWAALERGELTLPEFHAELESEANSVGFSIDAARLMGMIATGFGGSPSATLWWQSADGQQWQALPTFAPLGTVTCGGSFCSPHPSGIVLGDGHRLVALRPGTGGAGWVSTDGEHWAPLSFAGDLPDAQARQATLLPGGILLSNGTTTWFGQAEGG